MGDEESDGRVDVASVSGHNAPVPVAVAVCERHHCHGEDSRCLVVGDGEPVTPLVPGGFHYDAAQLVYGPPAPVLGAVSEPLVIGTRDGHRLSVCCCHQSLVGDRGVLHEPEDEDERS